MWERQGPEFSNITVFETSLLERNIDFGIVAGRGRIHSGNNPVNIKLQSGPFYTVAPPPKVRKIRKLDPFCNATLSTWTGNGQKSRFDN